MEPTRCSPFARMRQRIPAPLQLVLLVALLALLVTHWSYPLTLVPFALILLCPLLHLVMHGGSGGHHHGGDSQQ